MPGENSNWKWVKVFLDRFPLWKLKRPEVANLSCSMVALYFTIRFSANVTNEPAAFFLFAWVITMAFVCVMWACKQ
jgi:hypothetical protein